MTTWERPPVYTARCAAACSNPLATEAALRILHAGGTAADAAVAAGAVLAVVEPWASHLGGDAFALVWDASSERIRAIQGSGAAPRRAPGADAMRAMGGIPLRGPIPTTVPGMIGAWFHLLATRGRLRPAEVFAPAIDLASAGAPASSRWERMGRLHRALLATDPPLSALFLRGADPLPAGSRVLQPDLARSLEGLASEGPDYFYRGPLGRRLAAAVQERGGVLDEDDLATHETEEREPLRFDCGGGRIVFEQPPVSQGVLVLLALGALAEADDRGWSLPPGEARGIAREMHLQIEAYRRARADRDLWLGDPRFIAIEDRMADRLSPEHARSRCSELDPLRIAGSAPSSPRAPDVRDTTYLCVADDAGNAVSWIQSIFHPFGSGWIVPGTGMLLNNRMTGFSLEDGSPNLLEPGRRPIHTLNTWMILRDGKPWLIGGTPGGEAQIQVNIQILRARLARGASLVEAIRAPRWRIDERGRVAVEGRIPREARRRLERAGHEVVRLGPWEGSGFVQAIERLADGGWLACTDPRGEGMAAGA